MPPSKKALGSLPPNLFQVQMAKQYEGFSVWQGYTISKLALSWRSKRILKKFQALDQHGMHPGI